MEKARLSRSCIYVCSHDIYPSITFVLSCWCCMYHNPCPPTGCRYPIWKRSAHFHSRNGGCESDKLAFAQAPKNLLASNKKLQTSEEVLQHPFHKVFNNISKWKTRLFFSPFVDLQENYLFTINIRRCHSWLQVKRENPWINLQQSLLN